MIEVVSVRPDGSMHEGETGLTLKRREPPLNKISLLLYTPGYNEIAGLCET